LERSLAQYIGCVGPEMAPRLGFAGEGKAVAMPFSTRHLKPIMYISAAEFFPCQNQAHVHSPSGHDGRFAGMAKGVSR